MSSDMSKKLILRLRVKELQELLMFSKVITDGLKPDLQNRALNLLDKRTPIGFTKKLLELTENVKIPLKSLCSRRRKSSSFKKKSSSVPREKDCNLLENDLRITVAELYPRSRNNLISSQSNIEDFDNDIDVLQSDSDSGNIPEQNSVFPNLDDSPFFESKCSILAPSEMKLDHCDSGQTFQFVLNTKIIQNILSGRTRDGVYDKEIQLRFFYNDVIKKHWSPKIIKIEVNGMKLVVQDEKSPIYYITKLCSFVCGETNQILVSWLANSGSGYMLMVNFVKRKSVIEMVRMCPLHKNKDLTELIYNKMVAARNETIKVSLMCVLSKNRINWPCRSKSCTSIHFFDLTVLISNMERKMSVTCPICESIITYDSLIYDDEFHQLIRELPAVKYVIFDKTINAVNGNINSPDLEQDVITLE